MPHEQSYDFRSTFFDFGGVCRGSFAGNLESLLASESEASHFTLESGLPRSGRGLQEYLKVGRKDVNIHVGLVFVLRIPVRSFS